MLRVDRATKEKKGVEIRTEAVGKVKREGGGDIEERKSCARTMLKGPIYKDKQDLLPSP